jgi:Protein of unknown function (DUF2726)
MQQTLPWIVALIAVAVLAPSVVWFALRPRTPAVKPLPDEWNLSARPVFSTDERRVYRQLREALPHHIVLSKLPLVRFCQPTDPQEVRFWYELLGAIHVTFAVCSANGRVLAAIDLDTDRGNSRRIMQIKQAVLAACRVRYLRCPVDHMPSIPELQLLVPHSVAASRGPHPAAAPALQRREIAPATPSSRRRERATLWQDSNFFQDSFFAPDNRADSPSSSEFGTLGSGQSPGLEVHEGPPTEPPTEPPADVGDAVVIDTPRFPAPSIRH